MNQDQIAKTLCEKKEEKENTCNGHCHLKKELKKIEESSTKTSTPSVFKQKLEWVFIIPVMEYNFLKLSSNRKQSSNYTENVFPLRVTKIFHPPLG